MKLPGFLTLSLVFRRLAGELKETNKVLRELAETQALALKLDAIKAGMTLSELKETEEETPAEIAARVAAGEDQPEFLAQSDAELAVEERLREAYFKAHGKDPDDSEDLIELFKKGGGEAAALRAAGEALELERNERKG